MERGKFFVLEGVGGAGKSTQLLHAEAFIQEELGLPVITTREPGGVAEAELIRELIFDLKREGVINADHQMALFFASRAIWMANFVQPNLDKGVTVLSDRTFPSTAAYQGYGEGGQLEVIEAFAEKIMGKYRPDAVLLLDISAKTAVERKIEKDGDPFDGQATEYFERVVAGYREMANTRWADLNWYVIDAEGSVEEVAVQIKDCLRAVLAI